MTALVARMCGVLSVLVFTSLTLAGCAGEPGPVASPVGAALPSGEDCSRRVARHDREVRPTNAVANATVPAAAPLPPWPNYWDPVVDVTVVPRIDGRYAGTTEDVIAWGACKWGLDPGVVRALAWTESSWFQSKVGDVEDRQQLCVAPYTAPCPTSFGLLQIKHIYRPGSYPLSQQSTAFNVDYGLAVIRGCYEGRVLYLRPPYRAGDLWGCLGWHYTGEWDTPLGRWYVAQVRQNLHDEPWTGL